MSDPAHILAVPHELAAREFEFAARRLADDLTYGMDSSRLVGAGVGYAQSRGLVFGDSARDIDWRVTARTGRLHVREYQATKRVPVFIVVDTSASMAMSTTRLSKHDLAVWMGAVLALVSLNRRCPTAVISGGDREAAVAPSLARGTVWRHIEALRAPGWNEQTRLTDAIARIESLSLHTSLVFVLSDLHSPDAARALRRLAQRHGCVALQLRDPGEGGRLRAGFLRASEAETGAAFLAGGRTRFQGAGAKPLRLGDAGVDHAVFDTNGPILEPLRRLVEAHASGWRPAR